MGFQATLGSYGASAIVGAVALLGILLVLMSKKKDGTRNNILFGLGIAIVAIAALPYIPIFGLSIVADSLGSD